MDAFQDAETVFTLLNDGGQGVNNAGNTAVGYRLTRAADLFRDIQKLPADLLDVPASAMVDMPERFFSRFADAQAKYDAKPADTGNHLQDMIAKSQYIERVIKAVMDFVENPLESNAKKIYSEPTKQRYDEIKAEIHQTLTTASKQIIQAAKIIGPYAGVEPINPKKVFLRAFNGLFVSAKLHLEKELVADREEVDEWEIFDIFWLGGEKIALRAFNKLFVMAHLEQNGELLATRPNVQEWETFTVHYLDDDKIALQAFNGLFVSAKLHQQNQLAADREEVDEWETFNLLWV